MEPFTGIAICASMAVPLYTYTLWLVYMDY
jgi:hypothetical protein